MDLYTDTCYELSKILTKRYSTSFSLSTSILDKNIQKHIYAIYGMVRVADEIVDTLSSSVSAKQHLDKFQIDVMDAIKNGYSPNPIIHSFSNTANKYDISKDLIDPFFESMRMDLGKKTYSQKDYEAYIYGSSEVIGLMCLKVFTNNNKNGYEALKDSASRLGSAYQKVNFLRDIKADYESLNRIYFPKINFESFSDDQKDKIVSDIKNDFNKAMPGIEKLPKCAKIAVTSSYLYYRALLNKLERSSARTIKSRRIRVSNFNKILLLIKAKIRVML